MTRVAVCNQKGGVGKTTVTLGLASAALHAGRSVAVVDLDPQASATWALGIDEPTGLAEAFATGGASSARDTFVESGWSPDLVVSCGGAELEGHVPDGGPKTSAKALGKVLGKSDTDIDWTFIDCPPGLGALTVNALAAADLAVVVVEPSAFSNNTMSAVADLVDDVWDRFNPSLDLAGVIMNRLPAIGREAHVRFDELGKIVGRSAIWKPAIARRVIIGEAQGARRPIHSYGSRAHDVIEAFDSHHRKLERIKKARQG